MRCNGCDSFCKGDDSFSLDKSNRVIDMLIDIVHFILVTVLGPSNYYKGINCMRTSYDVPSLALLLDTIEAANRLNRPVEIDDDIILNGIDEFKRILTLS